MLVKGFVDLECKCRQRQLDRAGRVAKLPTTDLKNIQMFVAPAEGHLKCRMKLSQSTPIAFGAETVRVFSR